MNHLNAKHQYRTYTHILMSLLAAMLFIPILTKPPATFAQAATLTYTPYTPSITLTPSNTPTTIPTISASLDNRQIITVDNAARIQKYRVWQAQYGPVNGVAFIPQTRKLVSVGYEVNNFEDAKPIRLWDIQTRAVVPIEDFFQGIPKKFRTNVSSLSVSSDGTRIVAAVNNGGVNVWDAQSGGLVGRALQNHINASVLTGGNQWILAGGEMRFIGLWTIPSYIPTSEAELSMMPTDFVYDPQAGLTNTFPIDEDVSQVDYDLDTQQVFALTLTGRLIIYQFVNQRDYTVRVVPQAPASAKPSIWGLEGSHKMVLDSEQHIITYTDTNRDVIIYDYVANQVVKRYPLGDPTACLNYSADKRLLVMSDWGFDMSLQIIDTVTWKTVAQIPTGQAISACTLSWDDTWIATGDPNGQIVLWGVPK